MNIKVCLSNNCCLAILLELVITSSCSFLQSNHYIINCSQMCYVFIGPKPSELYGKYTWRIEKFSEINKRELRSNQFEVGGYKWYELLNTLFVILFLLRFLHIIVKCTNMHGNILEFAYMYISIYRYVNALFLFDKLCFCTLYVPCMHITTYLTFTCLRQFHRL